QSTYTDFIDLLHNKPPLVNPTLVRTSKLPGFFSENSSYRERFLARARKHGLAVSQESSRETLRDKLGIWLWAGLGYVTVATLAVAVLLVTVAFLGYSLRQSNARYRTLAADMGAMSKGFSQQSSPGSSQAESRSEEPSLNTRPAPPVALPSGLMNNGELIKARAAAAEERSKTLETQLEKAASDLQALRAQHEEVSNSRDQLAKTLTEAEQTVTRVSDELRRIREGRSDDAATIAAQGLEIRELSEKLNAQTEMLERERTLLAAGRDIHDLMGARNLHIVDVLDVDSKGKDRRAFGRVFYTEEKSLIFYAFDLSDRGTARRNASFQVWGARGPAQSPAQSLGIFYVDDQKQNRWVLKFEDPHIL